MSKTRSWTDEQLIAAVKESRSYRMVLQKIGLVPAGGNYKHVLLSINKLGLNTDHFMGKGWNVGWTFDPRKARLSLNEILVRGRPTQSHKLRLRLISEGLKKPTCELCGWHEMAPDGRLPLELDHINGDPNDNRLDNLRILCPNCHSLQPTHRGKNKKVRYARVT